MTTGDSIGWLFVEAGNSPDADRLLARLVPQVRRLTRERDGATGELVERYEEISLLYAIGELLGGTTSVENVADTLLRELAVTVGATRAVFLQNNRNSATLVPIATLGLDDVEYPTISFDQVGHIAVTAYRSAGAITEDGAAARASDPVLTARGGRVDGRRHHATEHRGRHHGHTSDPRFVVATSSSRARRFPLACSCWVDGRMDKPFSAGDRKLAVAVGTQIGTAMHKRLARSGGRRAAAAGAGDCVWRTTCSSSSSPKPAVVGPEARAAARLVPAESVGGDFFLLARLDRDRTGVLIGDVSGHGYQSALVDGAGAQRGGDSCAGGVRSVDCARCRATLARRRTLVHRDVDHDVLRRDRHAGR